MPTHLAAIDLSDRRARIIVVDSSVRRSEVSLVTTVERESEEVFEDFLSRVRQTLPEQVDTLSMASYGDLASTRVLKFPFTDMRKIESAIDFELEGQIPYDLDEVLRSWMVIGRSTAETQVLCVLVPLTQITESLTTLAASGLEPRSMVLPAAVLSELHPASVAQTQDPETAAVVAIGSAQNAYRGCALRVTLLPRFAIGRTGTRCCNRSSLWH
ncbi:MAG: hypothetical protein R3C68_13825 [Myxococcota bacterium]